MSSACHAFQLRAGGAGFGLHLEGIDKLSPRVRHTAGVDHACGANIFFIHDISIAMQYAAEVFENLSGNLAAAGHLEVEDHALAWRRVLPEEGTMVRVYFLRDLHADVGFVGLDIVAGEQVALHNIDHRSS